MDGTGRTRSGHQDTRSRRGEPCGFSSGRGPLQFDPFQQHDERRDQDRPHQEGIEQDAQAEREASSRSDVRLPVSIEPTFRP